MPKTLVTGANGFLAATIIDQLVSQGHEVVGSIRSAEKGKDILAAHPEYVGKLSFVIVPNYAASGTWDKTIEEGGFDYIIHTAAPLLDDVRNTDFKRDFLEPSVSSALELLKSASMFGKHIKAVAVTGSVNAMTTGEDIATRSFNSQEWLPLTITDAIKSNHNYISYCVAKAEAEKAIWRFVENTKPSYTVSIPLPALIFGPPIQPISGLKKMNFSTDQFYSLFNGTHSSTPPTPFPSYIDVRDLATAHILSLTTPGVANKRFLVGGQRYTSQIAIDVLKGIPELEKRLPSDNKIEVPEIVMNDVLEWNTKLGLKLRSPEETFGDAARKILELESVFGDH